jgi:hypothetical protein
MKIGALSSQKEGQTSLLSIRKPRETFLAVKNRFTLALIRVIACSQETYQAF